MREKESEEYLELDEDSDDGEVEEDSDEESGEDSKDELEIPLEVIEEVGEELEDELLGSFSLGGLKLGVGSRSEVSKRPQLERKVRRENFVSEDLSEVLEDSLIVSPEVLEGKKDYEDSSFEEREDFGKRDESRGEGSDFYKDSRGGKVDVNYNEFRPERDVYNAPGGMYNAPIEESYNVFKEDDLSDKWQRREERNLESRRRGGLSRIDAAGFEIVDSRGNRIDDLNGVGKIRSGVEEVDRKYEMGEE
ncbi:MAG: hypothetical protein ABIF88_04100 [archaeon]